jgi:hypothetical protein
MRLRNCLVPALPLAALALAGCGGGGGEESTAATAPTTTSAISKEELISQGDGICAEVNAAVGTVAASEAETSSRITQEADLYTGMVERLKGLGEPEDAAGYSEFIAAADELSQAQSNAKLASEREEEAGLESAETEAASALSAFQSAASSYGFEKCSEEPSVPAATPSTGSGSPAAEEEVEVAPEAVEEVAPEEAPEEVAPETGGGGAPEGGGTGTGEGGSTGGGGSGGIGPG